ncbi:hypothetical protein G6F57_018150 [Rhizopus arrhizus]|nr:hypothetical protein G6F57_018150 [Rhizopus arrhizus]
MAKDPPIQNTFDGGGLSPLLAGRTDLVKYFTGCAVLEHFLPSVQGPLVRRGGTQYIFGIKSGAVRSWLIRFQVSERVSYMLEFGHLYVRFYTNRGLLVVGGSPVEVSTPYTAADLTAEDGTCNLRVVQSADTMYIFHRLYQTRKLLRLSATSFSMVLADFTEGPFDDRGHFPAGARRNALLPGDRRPIRRKTVGRLSGSEHRNPAPGRRPGLSKHDCGSGEL